MSFYGFNNGVFVEAESFTEAQDKLIEEIRSEQEIVKNWSECTCLGFSHQFGCHVLEDMDVPL